MLLGLCPICPDMAWLLPGALLYAEMHYRWWTLPSRYCEKEPEILADAPPRVQQGQTAELVVLRPNEEYTFNRENIYSRSRNTPLLGRLFTGRVLATVTNRGWYLPG